MIKIIICDDELFYANYLERMIREKFMQVHIPVDITIFTESSKMLHSLDTHTSLYFLDIKMPEISGMELASEILKKAPSAKLVFVSSFEDAVFESFRYQPLRFIRKERLAEELPEAIESFLSTSRTEAAFIALHTTTGNVHILLSELIYVESKAHYLYFHCLNEVFHVRGKIADYLDLLHLHGFIHPGKSFLVNCQYITSFSSSYIEIQGGMCISISRDKKDLIRSEYMQYTRKKLFI